MSAPSPRRPVDHGRDPVGLLQPQLLRALDDRLALGEAAEQRDERQLVDRERDLVRGSRASRSAGRGRPRASRAARCPARRSRGVSSAPVRSAPIRSRMRKNPTRVQLRRHPGHGQPRAGHERGRRHVERGRRRVARDVDRLERRAPSGGVTVIRSPSRVRPAPAAVSSRSVWSRLGLGLDDGGRRPRRAGPRAARTT